MLNFHIIYIQTIPYYIGGGFQNFSFGLSQRLHEIWGIDMENWQGHGIKYNCKITFFLNNTKYPMDLEVYSVDDLFGTFLSKPTSAPPALVTFHLRGDSEMFNVDKTYLEYIENQKRPSRFIFESADMAEHSGIGKITPN